LAERYVLDFIVWVSLITGDHDYVENLEARFLLALASKTCTNFYVTASLEKLSERSCLNQNLLGDQLTLYDKMALALNAYTLNTTAKHADESLEELLNALEIHGVW